MAQAFAQKFGADSGRQYSETPAGALARRPDDHWTPRETLVFVAASSALLWMMILETVRVI